MIDEQSYNERNFGGDSGLRPKQVNCFFEFAFVHGVSQCEVGDFGRREHIFPQIRSSNFFARDVERDFIEFVRQIPQRNFRQYSQPLVEMPPCLSAHDFAQRRKFFVQPLVDFPRAQRFRLQHRADLRNYFVKLAAFIGSLRREDYVICRLHIAQDIFQPLEFFIRIEKGRIFDEHDIFGSEKRRAVNRADNFAEFGFGIAVDD